MTTTGPPEEPATPPAPPLSQPITTQATTAQPTASTLATLAAQSRATPAQPTTGQPTTGQVPTGRVPATQRTTAQPTAAQPSAAPSPAKPTTAKPTTTQPTTTTEPTSAQPTPAQPAAVQGAAVPDSPGQPPAGPGRDVGMLVDNVGLSQLTKILGSFVAPTTLLTALLYYFGWSHAYWFFDYFGVNSTVLGLTTEDYLMRSVDALFVPMTACATAGLLALWGHTLLQAGISAGYQPRWLRLIMPALAAAGLVLGVGGFVSVFTSTVLSEHLTAAPLSLALGVLLLTYSMHLRRSLQAESTGPAMARRPDWAVMAEWAVVFTLVGLSLFWAAGDYSAAVGTSRARDFVAKLPGYPGVVLYSARSLSLNAPGVRETKCRDPQAAYPFRYDGLKLMLRSGDQYLFLPQAWTPANGAAILVPRNDSLRLEFTPAAASGTQSRGC
jgi:hypothetical protein